MGLRSMFRDIPRAFAIDSFTEHPGITEQLLAAQGARAGMGHVLSVREALAIPAVWRSCSLIANLTGTFTMLAYRNGSRMAEPPRLIQRPDPFRTSRAFYRDTAWNLATRGEAIWYVGAFDPDGIPLSLLNTDPAEWMVDWSEKSLGTREYRWRDAEVPANRVRHITFAQESGSARGIGPLQMCGAALTVAREAEEWAARFFDCPVPAIALIPNRPVDKEEAEGILEIWNLRAGNTARVISAADVKPINVSPEAAQLTESRLQNVGEVARMFGLPAKLLEYAVAGSSLTYQNAGDVAADLIRFCLSPGYLEPIEQEMSDLLTRSTVARFDVDGIQRADAKSRMEIHTLAITAGIYDAAHAAQIEGITAGSAGARPHPAQHCGCEAARRASHDEGSPIPRSEHRRGTAEHLAPPFPLRARHR